LEKAKADKKFSQELLNHPSELKLMKELLKFPELVEDTAQDYQLQRLPAYTLELSAAFHQFYHDCRVISENKKLTKARLSLVLAAKIVLKNTLDLMGISAPDKM
jgi:arginyl-tRNA synthetase